MKKKWTSWAIRSFTILAVVVTCNNAFAIDAPELTVSTSGLDVTASWSSVSGATGYTLFYAPYPYEGEHTIGNMDMSTAMNFSATLWDGASYYVAITTSDGTNESGYSNIELFTITNNSSVTVNDFNSDGVQDEVIITQLNNEITVVTTFENQPNNSPEQIVLTVSKQGHTLELKFTSVQKNIYGTSDQDLNDLKEQIKIETKDSEQHQGLLEISIPKELISLLSETDFIASIDSELVQPGQLFIVEDDPVIGWYFNESDGSEGLVEDYSDMPVLDDLIDLYVNIVMETETYTGPNLIKVSASGSELDVSSASWTCVKDRASGLTWQANSREFVGWYDDTQQFSCPADDYRNPGGYINCDLNITNTIDYVNEINSSQLCNKLSWRLPTLSELQTLLTERYANSVVSNYLDGFGNSYTNMQWEDKYYDPYYFPGILNIRNGFVWTSDVTNVQTNPSVYDVKTIDFRTNSIKQVYRGNIGSALLVTDSPWTF
jgi:hypothetical protein